MKIVMICQWFPPEHAPIGVMLSEMAEDLIQKGHSVSIITGFPNHPEGIVFKGYNKKIFNKEDESGLKIIRCYLYTSPKKTFLRRAANYLSFAMSSFVAAMCMEKHDVLLMVSPPLSNGLIAIALKKIKKLRFVFNVQDIYPDAAISTEIIKNPFLIKVLMKLEQIIYHEAKSVSLISEGFKNNLLAKGVPEEKINVIENWIDTNEIVPMNKHNDFSIKHELIDKFVILYSGTIGIISGAEIIIDCAKNLSDYEDILFLFVGEGIVKDEIRKKVNQLSLKNIKFLSFQPRKLLSEVQSCSDVSVLTLAKDKGKTSVPSKILGYMAAARPVVASIDESSDTHRLINEAKCGICVEPGNADNLSDIILTLYHDRHLAEQLGRNGREFLMNNCGRKKITSQYEKMFLECDKDLPHA